MSVRSALLPVARRTFSSSSRSSATFQYNDITTLGYHKLISMQESVELGEKVRAHEEALMAQREPFVPPTSPIKITQSVELVWKSQHVAKKRTIIVPVSSLPLNTPEAVHRLKVIAGQRWSPGEPGLKELEETTTGVGKDGWLKMSENRFEEGMMNRRALADTLKRLITAANDEKSPITMDIPIDLRHLYARRRRQKESLTHAQDHAMKSRETIKDLARGYPKAWLGEEVKQRAEKAKETRRPVFT